MVAASSLIAAQAHSSGGTASDEAHRTPQMCVWHSVGPDREDWPMYQPSAGALPPNTLQRDRTKEGISFPTFFIHLALISTF
jgi:hypothetical protein